MATEVIIKYEYYICTYAVLFAGKKFCPRYDYTPNMNMASEYKPMHTS